MITINNIDHTHWDNSKLLKEVDEIFKIDKYGFLVSHEFKSRSKVVIITKIESNHLHNKNEYFISICHDIIEAYKNEYNESNYWHSFNSIQENCSKQYFIKEFKSESENKKLTNLHQNYYDYWIKYLS